MNTERGPRKGLQIYKVTIPANWNVNTLDGYQATVQSKITDSQDSTMINGGIFLS